MSSTASPSTSSTTVLVTTATSCLGTSPCPQCDRWPHDVRNGATGSSGSRAKPDHVSFDSFDRNRKALGFGIFSGFPVAHHLPTAGRCNSRCKGACAPRPSFSLQLAHVLYRLAVHHLSHRHHQLAAHAVFCSSPVISYTIISSMPPTDITLPNRSLLPARPRDLLRNLQCVACLCCLR